MNFRALINLLITVSVLGCCGSTSFAKDAGVRQLRKFAYVSVLCPGNRTDGSVREDLVVNLVNGYGVRESITLVIRDKKRLRVYRAVEVFGSDTEIADWIRFSKNMSKPEEKQSSIMLSLLLPAAKACADKNNPFWKEIESNYDRLATYDKRAAGHEKLLKDRATGVLW